MNNKGIVKTSNLSNDDKLYRYINLKQFISLIESNQISLTKITKWEDTWEIPEGKIPALLDNGEISYPKWSIDEIMYGMCWSRKMESDALWRIYSPNKDGLILQTSVEKFNQLNEIHYGLLAPVIYYDNLLKALQELQENNEYPHPFSRAFLKRTAFEHEYEVRLVTFNDEKCLNITRENDNFINISLNPLNFIENIIIDPRADDWYVETIKKYCARAGFSFVPIRSNLYKADLYKEAKIVMKFTPVD